MTDSKKTNVVFWKDQGPDDIIYKSESDDLRTITSVTVPEHAVALFIRDGQLMGTLEPGRHIVTSANIPWLT
ncbi:MAG: SPFH domain-containing protein, partial [Methanomethylophilus sp.]